MNNTKTVGPADAWPACITCPAGYYCIEATVTPKPCGKGKFSTSGSKTCPPCEAGYFCNSETTSAANMRSNALGWASPGALYGTCYNGSYCPAGSDSEPALETDACPPAYYCPTATPAPVICPAGTYSNLTGQDSISDCTPTPAGYFSVAGALEPTGVCSPGFYCPLRSTSRTQVPCPARYYLNRSMGQSEEDCAVCVSGSYCPIGSAYPTTCPAGYYCRTGISSPEPCPIGTYATATGLRTVEDCVPCPPGLYCDSTALTTPRGLCDPGYYCTLGAYTSAPMNYESTLFGVTNRHTGDQCPQGAYCPLGSSSPTLCPPGTFNNFTGLDAFRAHLGSIVKRQDFFCRQIAVIPVSSASVALLFRRKWRPQLDRTRLSEPLLRRRAHLANITSIRLKISASSALQVSTAAYRELSRQPCVQLGTIALKAPAYPSNAYQVLLPTSKVLLKLISVNHVPVASTAILTGCQHQVGRV
ncbi:hypothetical protein DVH05_016093 [Phytophthora capsici]|nr:hypothetical protein DVH05_016093 [Phytophthora capsici]